MKSQLWFPVMLFISSCKTWNVVKPGAWLARPPPGAQQSQDSSPVLFRVLQVLQAGRKRRQSLTVTQNSVQAG